jgi:hypothetical protein
MGQAALKALTPQGDATAITYGNVPMNPATWDFDQIQMCLCQEGWEGIDCNSRSCSRSDDQNTPGLAEQQTFTCRITYGEPANGLSSKFASGRQPIMTSVPQHVDSNFDGIAETANPFYCGGPPPGKCTTNTEIGSTHQADEQRRSKAGVCYKSITNKKMTAFSGVIKDTLQEAIDVCSTGNSAKMCGGVVKQRKGTERDSGDPNWQPARTQYGEWEWEYALFVGGGALNQSMPACQPDCVNEDVFVPQPYTVTFLKVPCEFSFRFRCPFDEEQLCVQNGFQTPNFTAASTAKEVEMGINALHTVRTGTVKLQLLTPTFFDNSLCGGTLSSSAVSEFRLTFTQTFGDIPMIQIVTPGGAERHTFAPICVNDCLCADGNAPSSFVGGIATCTDESIPSGCKAEVCVGGDAAASECIFPFLHNGIEHNSCTSTAFPNGKVNTGQAWCYTGGGANPMSLEDESKKYAICDCQNCGFTVIGRETERGSLEDAECANHGICDHATGECSCYSGYSASDGFYQRGEIDDCGYRLPMEVGGSGGD